MTGLPVGRLDHNSGNGASSFSLRSKTVSNLFQSLALFTGVGGVLVDGPSEVEGGLGVSELSEDEGVTVVRAFKSQSGESGISATDLESIEDSMFNSVTSLSQSDGRKTFRSNSTNRLNNTISEVSRLVRCSTHGGIDGVTIVSLAKSGL